MEADSSASVWSAGVGRSGQKSGLFLALVYREDEEPGVAYSQALAGPFTRGSWMKTQRSLYGQAPVEIQLAQGKILNLFTRLCLCEGKWSVSDRSCPPDRIEKKITASHRRTNTNT